MSDIWLPRENERILDLITDFWVIQKECRESIYYLSSLIDRLENLNFITVGCRTAKEMDEIQEASLILLQECKNIITEYEKKEKELSGEELPTNIEEIAFDMMNKGYACIEKPDSFILDITLQTIMIKQKSDSNQLKVLRYFYNELDYTIENYIKLFPEVRLIVLSSRIKRMNNKAFNHSVDKDRIDTYEIRCTDKEYCKTLRKLSYNVPIIMKVTNLDHHLKFYRESILYLNDLLMQLMSDGINIEETREIKKMNKHLYYTNIIVTILTIISTVIAIYGVVNTKENVKETHTLPTYEEFINEIKNNL